MQQEKLVKIDSKTAEVITTKTVTDTRIVNISDLVYERDSMIRTMNLEKDEFSRRQASLEAKVKEMNEEIKRFLDIGLSTEVIAPEVPVVVEEVKVKEEISTEESLKAVEEIKAAKEMGAAEEVVVEEVAPEVKE